MKLRLAHFEVKPNFSKIQQMNDQQFYISVLHLIEHIQLTTGKTSPNMTEVLLAKPYRVSIKKKIS